MSGENVILINRQKTHRDAFDDSNVFLYLPLDNDGNVVCPTVATRLECWTSGDVKHDRLPEVFSDTHTGISNALLWKRADHEFTFLARSVAFNSLKRFNDWLYTLNRLPGNDITYSKAYMADAK